MFCLDSGIVKHAEKKVREKEEIKKRKGKMRKRKGRKQEGRGKLVPNPNEVLGFYAEDSYLSRVKIHVMKSCYIIVTY